MTKKGITYYNKSLKLYVHDIYGIKNFFTFSKLSLYNIMDFLNAENNNFLLYIGAHILSKTIIKSNILYIYYL